MLLAGKSEVADTALMMTALYLHLSRGGSEGREAMGMRGFKVSMYQDIRI